VQLLMAVEQDKPHLLGGEINLDVPIIAVRERKSRRVVSYGSNIAFLSPTACSCPFCEHNGSVVIESRYSLAPTAPSTCSGLLRIDQKSWSEL
jgi:hypothetical protein